MWQFQWMLSLIPDSVLHLIIHTVFLSGVILFFVCKFGSKLKLLSGLYGFVFKLIALVVLLLGIFLEGSYFTEMSWRARVAEMQAKVDAAKIESDNANKKIEAKIITKTKVIHEKGLVVKQYIDREVTKYDNQCIIPQEFVKAHNNAAEAPK